MERVCEYCGNSFIPKRTDALYCSHSCRQLAYVLRKASTVGSYKISESEDEISINGFKNKEASTTHKITMNDPSIENVNAKEMSTELTDQIGEPSIIQDPSNSYPSIKKEIPVNKKLTNQELAVNKEVKPTVISEEYKDYSSPLLSEIAELTDTRNNFGILYSFLNNRTEGPAYWISIRYRCLLECLLTLSEMQSVSLDDLKEICNAFTYVIQSRSFGCMIPEYPYMKEIPRLRDTIRTLCSNADEETIVFRLKKETKLQLIAARWELANYVPKLGFDQLNFKE